MASPNYSYEKRQKDLAKKRKQEEKRQRKAEKKSSSGPSVETEPTDAAETAAPEEGEAPKE